jgi:hypothetical protein
MSSPATETHECAAVGCQQQVPRGLLMCLTHWRLVPAPARRQVAATWHAARNAGPSAQARLQAINEHRAACAAAVQAVRDKQVARVARADAQTPPLF